MIPSIYTTRDLVQYYEYSQSGHFFKPDTMRFFKSKLTCNFKKLSATQYLFITTEKHHTGERKATLRLATVQSDESFVGYKIVKIGRAHV